MKPKKQISDIEKIQELTDDLKRVQAEFENYKKRTEKDRVKNCETSKAELMKKILPVIDTFESALKSRKTKEEKKEEIKGLELIYVQLMKTLTEEGLTEINAKGRFNPDFHEAMLQQQSDDFDDEEIIDVMQKGYKVKECIIRPAKVSINRKSKRLSKEGGDKMEKIFSEEQGGARLDSSDVIENTKDLKKVKGTADPCKDYFINKD